MILTIMFQDVSRQTVLQFLKILYTGFAEGLKVGDFDSVHKLCELLGVSLNDSSVSFDSKSKNKGNICCYIHNKRFANRIMIHLEGRLNVLKIFYFQTNPVKVQVGRRKRLW